MINYPVSRKTEQQDSYHGTVVQDPYRWLEDDRSAETGEWIKRQNAVTAEYLRTIPYREQLFQRLRILADYPRVSAPDVKGPWHVFSRNEGLQNQAVYYQRRGENGSPLVLLDPNELSDDGTTRVGSLTINGSATYVAYMLSVAGSDWQQIRIIELESRKHLPDQIDWVKVSTIAWYGQGFFYSRYPTPPTTASALSSSNDEHLVYYHALGTRQADDLLIFENRQHQQRFHLVQTTDDEKIAVLYISDRGRGKNGTAMSVMRLGAPDAEFRSIWDTFDDEMTVIDHVDNHLFVLTNRHAPNRRVVDINLAAPDESLWKTVVAERDTPIDAITSAGGRLFVTYMKDVTSRVQILHLSGDVERELVLPGLGTVAGFVGERNAPSVYFTFASFTAPPAVYRYDIASGETVCTHASTVAFDSDQFETRQIFVSSKDGTRIPAFVVAKKGLQLTGDHPTLLYGYGGFNVSLPPMFSALRMAFLEQGGVYVQANLRGGNEYGESWHLAGTKANKQNVFDDAIAIAEWLCANGYTRSEQLAIQGGSNGGLLVGAIMTQRPELVRVALPSVGVLDMLRFHKFTIGWNWIADYGSSDNPQEFPYLYAYSPLHQLKPGTAYPATLISTGDHDDRVVPAHSFKFAARLQETHAGASPVLIRVETQSGHGSSSLTKSLHEAADIYAFLFHNLGVSPTFAGAGDTPLG